MQNYQQQNLQTPMMESEDDRKLLVRFFMDAVQDPAGSAEAGRPIFKDQPMISIIVPGSRDELICPASAGYRERFPRHWAAFQQQQAQPVDGTPLEEVPFLTVAQVRELRAINVMTLEQLAALSDQAMSRGMGLQSLKQKAQALLDAAADAAPLVALREALEERDNKIVTLENQIKRLEENLEKLMETEE